MSAPRLRRTGQLRAEEDRRRRALPRVARDSVRGCSPTDPLDAPLGLSATTINARGCDPMLRIGTRLCNKLSRGGHPKGFESAKKM